MRVSMCVGEYATTPYCIADLEIRVHCMEELCYCLRENAFLLDLSLLNERLVDWIGTDCGVQELATELYPMVRKQGSLSAFVILIMEYVGLYDSETIHEVERVLKEGSGLNGIEKRKNQVDYLVKKGKYPAAVRRYDDLLVKWQEEASQGADMPGGKVCASIWHNKGVALTGMMEYGAAAECFKEAWQLEKDEEHYLAYLASKRAELNENDYLAFVAAQPDSYEVSLRVEKEMDRIRESFEDTDAGRRLAELREWRSGGNKQRYYDELERIARTMKENYRNSVSEV